MAATSRSPVVLFVAWAPVPGRSADIARALGGEAWCDYDEKLRGRLTPVRYLRSALRQLAVLVTRRPRSVIATNPPVFCGLIAWIYCLVARVPFVLDSHPTSFGAKQNRTAQRLMPLHRFLARRASAVLVTTDEWVRAVETWGGNAIVTHEPPGEIGPRPRPDRQRPLVVFVGTFASDEPVDAVVEAARQLPEFDFAVTGRLERAPAELVRSAPSTVDFVGWLGPAPYRELLGEASIVVSLTTEPTSVMRSAYEAVYAHRPLVVTDTPALRSLFPDAVFVGNEGPSIAAGVRRAAADLEVLDSAAARAARRQAERWNDQLDDLRRATERRVTSR